MRAKNCDVRRIGKAVAHEHRVFILDVHVELADVVVEELHDLVFLDELSARQHDLMRALFVEFSQPLAPLTLVHR
jgi:hypothetical protein